MRQINVCEVDQDENSCPAVEPCLLAERCVLVAIGELVLPTLRRQLRAFLTSCVVRPELGEAEYIIVHMGTESDIFDC